MSRVSISAKSARAILEALDGFAAGEWRDSRPYTELRSALKPKVKKFVKTARKAKAAKKSAKREETAAIREAVMSRANGQCEHCGTFQTEFSPLEMDHAFGRAKARQSERNCWALCWDCHVKKTLNRPSSTAWFASFAVHAQRLGFDAEASRAMDRAQFTQARSALSEAR